MNQCDILNPGGGGGGLWLGKPTGIPELFL